MDMRSKTQYTRLIEGTMFEYAVMWGGLIRCKEWLLRL